MPCYRCAARQSDPSRGPSDWKRLVRRGEQVLVCPECQRTPGWDADADRCPRCGSATLSKSLGSVRCRRCGVVGHAGPASADAPDPGHPELSAEVRAALDRIFGRADASDA